MVKAEWCTKRTCPKCATRFYDLGNDDPITCINCRSTWVLEPVLKSKQPLTFEASPTKVAPEADKDEDLAGADEDLALVEDEEENPDDDVDLGGDDDIGLVGGGDDDEDV